MKKLIILVMMITVSFSYAANLLYDTTSDNFKTPVSINSNNAPVDEILASLANKAGVNLVQSEETKDKRVTLDLEDIPIKDALDLIIRATDLSYQVHENSIIVATPEKINREIGLNTSIYDLQYADAEQVKSILAGITKAVQIDKLGNRVIYQADPKKAKEIEKILVRIDRPLQQVLFKARIKEIGVENQSRYGLDWDKISSYRTTIREGSVVDWGEWEQDSETGAWTFEYDATNFPVRDLSGENSSYGPEFGRPSGFNGKYQSNTSSGFNDIWHRVISQEYLLSLDFKLRDNDATVIGEPEIATINNKEASVHVGDIIPYTITSIEQGTSKQSVQKENVGIKLTVRPIINEENDITVDVQAEVSSIFGWVGPNNEIPWIKTRKANTTVRVRDGQTIVIGGMMHEDNTVTVDKLPILGQIPFLGYLFQHHVNTKKTTNLVIEITPYILVDGEALIDSAEESDEFYEGDEKESMEESTTSDEEEGFDEFDEFGE